MNSKTLWQHVQDRHRVPLLIKKLFVIGASWQRENQFSTMELNISTTVQGRPPCPGVVGQVFVGCCCCCFFWGGCLLHFVVVFSHWLSFSFLLWCLLLDRKQSSVGREVRGSEELREGEISKWIVWKMLKKNLFTLLLLVCKFDACVYGTWSVLAGVGTCDEYQVYQN